MDDAVSTPTCNAKHAALDKSMDHIRASLEKIESRQWGVIVGILATLAITVFNIVLTRVIPPPATETRIVKEK